MFQANDRGDYFPVWGTCLGFEELTYLTLGKLVLVKNDMRDVALPLNFTDGKDLFFYFTYCNARAHAAHAFKRVPKDSRRENVAACFSEAKESKMFKDFPADLVKDLASEPLTANSHRWSLATSVRGFRSQEAKGKRRPNNCVFPPCFQAYYSNAALKSFYRVLSTNSDGTLEFVSTMEGKRAAARLRRGRLP